MTSKFLFPLIVLSGFGLGAYVWKILNIRQSHDRLMRLQESMTDSSRNILVNIDDTAVTKEDIGFEYRVLTMNLGEEDITSIPSFSNSQPTKIKPLRENIVDSLVERKMLFQLIRKDESFSLNDPSRYTDCLAQWSATIRSTPGLFDNEADKNRLKSRICEQSILKQYLSEKIFHTIRISDRDVHAYYETHKQDFVIPTKVTLRQIVLADERKARKIRAAVDRNNFASMARKHSITPEAAKGGKLGPFSIGYGMPRFFDVAFSMRTGQISDILKSTYGFHIIMLEKKIKERRLGFEEAGPRIRKKLKEAEKERAYQKWVDFALHSIRISTPNVLW